MNKVFKSNLFAMIIILLEILGMFFSKVLFKKVNLGLYGYMGVLNVIILLIPLIIYFVITRQSVKETLKIKKIDIKDILLIILISIFAQPIANFLSLMMTYIFPNRVGQMLVGTSNVNLFIRLFVIALMPAVLEEMCVRGIVLSGYKNIAFKKAAIATGFIFAMFHVNPQTILFTFALGILLAYLVHITGSIFSSMLCHFMINATQIIAAGFSAKKVAHQGSKQAASILEYPLAYRISITITVLVIATIALFVIIKLIKVLAKHHNYNFKGDVNNSEMLNIEIKSGELRVKRERIIDIPYIIMILVYACVTINTLLKL